MKKYKIKLKSYYEEELKENNFIFNNDNGRYEYSINNKVLISMKSWNKEFEFNTELSKEEVPEIIKLIIDIERYIEIEEVTNE